MRFTWLMSLLAARSIERTLRRVTLRYGSSHAPALKLLESQDVAVNLGVHSHFYEIGLGPYQYHLSFPPLHNIFSRTLSAFAMTRRQS